MRLVRRQVHQGKCYSQKTALPGFNADGSLKKKNTYKIDAKDNWIEGNFYNADGKLDFKVTNKYDDKGNQIEYNYENAADSIEDKYTYKYKYDEKGNWIKRIIFIDTKAWNIEEHTYEYYEQ